MRIMEYKIICQVSFGSLFEGGERKYEDKIVVALTQEEVNQIKSEISGKNSENVWEQVKTSLPQVAKKLIEVANDFIIYAYVLDTRLRGDDLINRDGAQEDTFMQEDIDSGEFKPYYTIEGKASDEMIGYQWVIWEIEHVKHLSYAERVAYFTKRYNYNINPVVTEEMLQDFDLAFLFPDEIFK